MQKQAVRKIFSQLFLPLLGAVGGVLYAVIDESTYQKILGGYPPKIVVVVHDLIDLILPVVFGILVGVGVNVLRRQLRLNKQLSMQNSQFQRELLINTLISQFLHEIRNPIHNLTAALEDSQRHLPENQREVIQRSLQRFEAIMAQYKKWDSTLNDIDPKETVLLRPWLENFVEDKVRSKLRELNAQYSQTVEPLKIHMHPLLLEQCFITLFSNACAELSEHHGPRNLELSIRLSSSHQKNEVEIKMTNSGRGFPAEVLKEQGLSPVSSRYGTGLGLLLLRKMLERTDGRMSLENARGRATVTLLVPGAHE